MNHFDEEYEDSPEEEENSYYSAPVSDRDLIIEIILGILIGIGFLLFFSASITH